MKITNSQITMSDMHFSAGHGVLPAERLIGNDFLVTITLTFDAGVAMMTDDLNRTVNYAEVYEIVRKEMDEPSALLEHVTHRILTALGEAFPILTQATCRLTKVTPPIPSFQSSGVAFTATASY